MSSDRHANALIEPPVRRSVRSGLPRHASRWTLRRQVTLRHRRLLGLLSVLSVVMGGLVAYALWHSEQTMAGATITSGNLDLELGEAHWEDMNLSQLMTWDGQSGDDLGQLNAYMSTPGDGLHMRQGFSVHGVGANLNVDLELNSAVDAVWTPQDAQVAYKVYLVQEDGTEAELSAGWTQLGDPLTVTDLGAGDHDLVLVVRWTLLGSHEVTQDLDAPSTLATKVFDFELIANQVRR